MAGMFLLTAAAVSCGKGDLYDPTTRHEVSIAFDWSENPLIDGESDRPTGMKMHFYPQPTTGTGSTEAEIYEVGPTGGSVNLTMGDYKMLAYNNDTREEVVHFRNMERFETGGGYVAEATEPTEAMQDAERLPGTKSGGGVVVYQPDRLHGGVWEGLRVTPEGGASGVVKPIPMVRVIRFDVDVAEIADVASSEGLLSGVASAVNLSTGESVPGSNARTAFSMTKTAKGVVGVVTVFGVNTPDTTGTKDLSQLKLSFHLNDGSVSTVTVDVSKAVEQASGNKIVVNVEVKGLHEMYVTAQVTGWQSGGDLNIDLI